MSAKDIIVRPISVQEASAIVCDVHYSGTTYNKSRLHLGVFYAGKLEGAMQFGPPLDQRKVMPLVSGSTWQGMIELNRMAFTDALPRNSESRALSVAFRMIRKHRPDIKWVLSYSDATRCGDGTIYRASGFVLTGIKRNSGIWQLPDGEIVTIVGMNTGAAAQRRLGYVQGSDTFHSWASRVGAKCLTGYQFRYIKFLDPTWVDRLTVPVIPFDQIPADARMYRGARPTAAASSEDGGHPPPQDGATPIQPLQGDKNG
jgi:hypothetical protein